MSAERDSQQLVDKLKKVLIVSLVSVSAVAWVLSINQPDMMAAMTTYDPVLISLFTASWTVGMAAMMFPAISPMVLLYKLISGSGSNAQALLQQDEKRSRPYPLKTILFVGSYLLVWAITGLALLLGWSLVMNNAVMTDTAEGVLQLNTIYGAILIVSGVYQFSPIKSRCLGYCESPMSFFMKRWSNGTYGTVKMGMYHGMYCLGCCWPYFLLMVALGWMDILWMGLFAAVIFGEKTWSRGIWVVRIAGAALAIVGVLAIAGVITTASLAGSMSAMMSDDDIGSMNSMLMTDSDGNSGNDTDVNGDMQSGSIVDQNEEETMAMQSH